MYSSVAFGIQQIKESVLFSVIRAGRITSGRTDAPISFCDQICHGQMLVGTETPSDARLLMEKFGKSFRKAIRQGLGQNCVIIIVRVGKFLRERICSMDG